MIHGDDPPPLDAPASQSPESLVRALRALGKEQPSDAALRATGLRLQARLNAPPIATPVETATVQVASSHTLLAGRLIMAALTAAVGVGAFVYFDQKPTSELQSARTATLPIDLRRSDAAPIVVPAAPPGPSATLRSSTTTDAPTTHESTPLPYTPPSHAPTPKVLESRRAHVDASHKAAPSSVTSTVAATPPTTVASTVQPATRVADAAATTQPAAEPVSAERTVQPKQAAISAGELSLLLGAQKQSRVDPGAVLSLTAEHARRFPDGVLAPEREVLAIEALRALGRAEQAKERLRRFRAAYPDSLHTRALTTGTSR